MSEQNSGLIYDWNTSDPMRRFIPKKPIEFDDETLRDGLQSPSVRTPTIEQKKELLHLAEVTGIHSLNIGLPGAGPHVQRDVIALAKEIIDNKLHIAANCAARTLKVDIDPIIEATQKTGLPIEASTFLGSSPIRQYTENWKIDKLLKLTEEAVSYAVKHGLEVMYVTEDTTRANPDDLRQLYLAAIRAGAKRLCIADTVGHATPRGVYNIIRFMKEVVRESGADDIKLDWHGHNDRMLGVINCIEAIISGIDRVHGTILGVGERVGNAKLDLLLVNLKLKGWINNDLTHLAEYVEKVSKYLGVPIVYNYPVFGRDAFRTGTGVHAAAIIKAIRKGDNDLADRVYSSVPAYLFGLEQVIEVGPMSGESNVIFWLEKRGYEPDPELVKKIFEKAKTAETILAEEEITAMCTAFFARGKAIADAH